MEIPESLLPNLSELINLLGEFDPTYKEKLYTATSSPMEGSSKLLNAISATQASTSSSEATQPFTTDDINKWSTKDVIQHLQAKFPGDFDAEDFEVLLKRKIRGRAFLKLTEGKLSDIGMEYGPASIIAGYIKELNCMYH
ncbi:hypothetical protein BC936DRAFT_138190 [Jimgerdemannia flammicorona]|uniref:SAM domain-containing protein n=1 Tax=Jimgerdemannia flammicorona TaxID=994334 RepID=A0A433CVI4_9FUNG|nr:hypothetical protein BC936DRAFT_138190 [Jimgerdemannia flammicorona]